MINREQASDVGFLWHGRLRFVVLLALVLAVTTGHWWTPHYNEYLRAFHIVLRKLYFLPIILAAIWFNLRGGILIATLITLLYSMHVVFQWKGETFENINQIGEIATVWVIAVLSGIFIRLEKHALQEVARTHEGSVIALAAALDAREHETELHSLRVRAYAVRIGRELGINMRQTRILGQASLLHDIGKIGTPDHILLKPGPLDNEEWEVIRQHPQTARRVLWSVPFLKEVADIVYCHHERYDGSGYPRGLFGEQIPFLSRVFAVADVFDALTSDRPYHRRLACQQARQEISKEKGGHFEPKVVDAFLAISCSEWSRIEAQVVNRAASITSLPNQFANGLV